MKKFTLSTTTLRTLGQNVGGGPGSAVAEDPSFVFTGTNCATRSCK